MNNKLITIVLTLVVGTILAGSVLVPVLNDATKTEKTFTNDGYFRMTEYGTDTDVVFTWDYDNPHQITVNDVVVPIAANAINREPRVTVLFSSDTLLIRSLGDSNGEFIGVQAYTSTSLSPKSCYVGMTTPSDMTVTCSNGTATVASYGADLTASYTKVYVPSNDGEFIMKDKDKSAYLLEDSEIHAFGLTNLTKSGGGTEAVGLYLDGSIADDVTIDEWRFDTNNYSIAYSDKSVNATAVNGYENLYSLSSVTFTAELTTLGDAPETTDTDVTYSYFLVPYQVTAELSQHLSPSEIALMGAIPIMVIVALLVVAVGVVARRND